MSDAPSAAPRLPLVERLSGWIAVLGGILSLAVALLVVASVLGRWLKGSAWADSLGLGPINGDFEFVKMGTAVSVFAFLPYCQARRGNIVVDTFTNWLPRRANAFIDAFWDLVYAAMMGLIAYCLVNGTLDTYRSGETTMMLQLIAWPPIALCAALCVLLVLVTIATAVRQVRGRP